MTQRRTQKTCRHGDQRYWKQPLQVSEHGKALSLFRERNQKTTNAATWVGISETDIGVSESRRHVSPDPSVPHPDFTVATPPDIDKCNI
jgi:hypothetical protein